MVQFSSLTTKDVLFTFMEPDSKYSTVFWVTGILNDPEYKALPVTHIGINLEFVRDWLHLRGIEAHRLAALKEVPTASFEPVSMAAWHDGSHLMIDGSHRYFVAARRGDVSIAAKLIPPSIWERFKVVGAPFVSEVELTSMKSGL